jgi:hypothetical protein
MQPYLHSSIIANLHLNNVSTTGTTRGDDGDERISENEGSGWDEGRGTC